jgi:hypothetical protein
LTFPIALIQSSDELLERTQLGGLTYARYLVLEAVRETFVVLAGQGYVIPAGTVRVPVEIDRITSSLGRILVPEDFQSVGSICYRVPGSKKTLEVGNERRIGSEPVREIPAGSHRAAKLPLEPIERDALEVGEGKSNSRLLIRKIGGSCRHIHGALKGKNIQLTRVGSVEYIRGSRCDRTLRFGGFRDGSDPVSQKLQGTRQRIIRLRRWLIRVLFGVGFRFRVGNGIRIMIRIRDTAVGREKILYLVTPFVPVVMACVDEV